MRAATISGVKCDKGEHLGWKYPESWKGESERALQREEGRSKRLWEREMGEALV